MAEEGLRQFFSGNLSLYPLRKRLAGQALAVTGIMRAYSKRRVWRCQQKTPPGKPDGVLSTCRRGVRV
jgi:hypothetical protein